MNTWLTLQPPSTVVLKAGDHSCRMIHTGREIWMITLSTRLLSLLIVARTLFPSLFLPLSLSVSLSLSTTIYECLVFLGLHEYQCVQLSIYDSSEDFQL